MCQFLSHVMAVFSIDQSSDKLKQTRRTQSNTVAFYQGLVLSGKSKALLLFGEDGLASSLVTVFKVDANLVSMNILRGFMRMHWSIKTRVLYSS